MTARSLLILPIVAAGVLAPAAIADAAQKPASKYPTITKISPMKISVGQTMTITGKGFIKGAKKNTVVFRRAGKRSIFVKADGVSTTRMQLKVPAKLAEVLSPAAAASGARFQLRVLARRFGKTYTSMTSSPTIVAAGLPTLPLPTVPGGTVTPAPAPAPAPTPKLAETVAAPTTSGGGGSGGGGGGSGDGGSDGGGTPTPVVTCADVDADDDNDLLADTTEAAIGTNRCLKDTDGDGVEDGWEYQSAVDLKSDSCPQPAGAPDPSWDYPQPCAAVTPSINIRSYPNPLNGDDADVDYDNDWLPMGEEFRAWKRKGETDLIDLWYSDGKQASLDTASDTPVDNACRGQAVPVPFNGTGHPLFAPPNTNQLYLEADTVTVRQAFRIYALSRGGDVCLNDAERDEDGDFLTNREELNAQMSGPGWWEGVYEEKTFRGTSGTTTYRGSDWLDANTDGHGYVDGLSDDDSDDFLNIEELHRGPAYWTATSTVPGPRTGLWVNPYNPCLPDIGSRTCPTGMPVGEPDAWPPFAADPPQRRWPLYRTALWGPVSYPNPAYDPDANPQTEPETLSGPVEVWTDVPLNEQTRPPRHPLPRPTLVP